MNEIVEVLLSFSRSGLVLLILSAAFLINKFVIEHFERKDKKIIFHQLVMGMIVLVGMLAFTVSLPIEHSVKGNIISLIGVVLSAAIALSSTAFIGNALAGIMNNSLKHFELGNFIRIEGHLGRVTRKGLFRTEIQTEDRNLTSLPNLYVSSHPIQLFRDSGTIISTKISLGYDVNRMRIESILLEAAKASGLSDPFVYLTELGDYSVTYKLSGLLKDVDKYFSANSILNANVMDFLHRNRIEIVSPQFRNLRNVDTRTFISTESMHPGNSKDRKAPEEVIFDKAIEADKIEDKIESMERIEKQVQKMEIKLKDSDADEKERIRTHIRHLNALKERLRMNIEERKQKLDNDK